MWGGSSDITDYIKWLFEHFENLTPMLTIPLFDDFSMGVWCEDSTKTTTIFDTYVNFSRPNDLENYSVYYNTYYAFTFGLLKGSELWCIHDQYEFNWKYNYATGTGVYEYTIPEYTMTINEYDVNVKLTIQGDYVYYYSDGTTYERTGTYSSNVSPKYGGILRSYDYDDVVKHTKAYDTALYAAYKAQNS